MYPAFQKTFQKKTLKGFSLGEVLLASFVLTTGLLSITALMTSSLKYSLESRDTIIAVELSQEGVELVRNVRDNDLAAGGTGFAVFSNSDKHCRINYTGSLSCLNNGLGRPSTLAHHSLYTLQYASSGLYRHNDTSAERFSRYIHIEYSGGGSPQATVTSFVYWGGSVAGTFDVSTAENAGNTANCTVAKKCVFTEVVLTSWKN